MKTYSFKVIVEPDGDRWHAFCPALIHRGGATWGYTEQEALKNIHDVIQMVVESLVEHGETVPEQPNDEVQLFADPQVAVTA